jgi:hypothetical protein
MESSMSTPSGPRRALAALEPDSALTAVVEMNQPG